MESLYRIIKNQNISHGEDISIIDTKIDSLVREDNMDLIYMEDQDKTNKEDISKLRDEIQKEIMVKTNDKRDNMLQSAREQAENIKIDAKKQGYKQGYTSGYEEGIEKAKIEAKNIKAQALKLIDEAEIYVSEYIEENKLQIIKLAAEMAEAIVNSTIEISDEDVLMLVKPILEKYEANGRIIITCNPQKVMYLKEKQEELENICNNTKFIIFGDESLGKNDCIIENEHQLIDLNIKGQIRSILKEINNVE